MGRNGTTRTRNAELGTRNRRVDLHPCVPRSAFRLPRSIRRYRPIALPDGGVESDGGRGAESGGGGGGGGDESGGGGAGGGVEGPASPPGPRLPSPLGGRTGEPGRT